MGCLFVFRWPCLGCISVLQHGGSQKQNPVVLALLVVGCIGGAWSGCAASWQLPLAELQLQGAYRADALHRQGAAQGPARLVQLIPGEQAAAGMGVDDISTSSAQQGGPRQQLRQVGCSSCAEA